MTERTHFTAYYTEPEMAVGVLSISHMEGNIGCVKTVRFYRRRECPMCNGGRLSNRSPNDEAHKYPCRICHGASKYIVPIGEGFSEQRIKNLLAAAGYGRLIDCPECGSGVKHFARDICGCGGVGYVRSPIDQDVTIQPGARTGKVYYNICGFEFVVNLTVTFPQGWKFSDENQSLTIGLECSPADIVCGFHRSIRVFEVIRVNLIGPIELGSIYRVKENIRYGGKAITLIIRPCLRIPTSLKTVNKYRLIQDHESKQMR